MGAALPVAHGQRGASAYSTAGAAEVGEQDECVQRPLQVDEASFCHCLLNRVDWTVFVELIRWQPEPSPQIV
jgi:hypothetical protein